MNANLAQIASDVTAIRLLLGTEMKKKKTKKAVERTLPPEHWEGFERSQKMLAERIAYHEARIAARERGDHPDAATA